MLFFAKELRYHDKEDIFFPRKGCASRKTIFARNAPFE